MLPAVLSAQHRFVYLNAVCQQLNGYTVSCGSDPLLGYRYRYLASDSVGKDESRLHAAGASADIAGDFIFLYVIDDLIPGLRIVLRKIGEYMLPIIAGIKLNGVDDFAIRKKMDGHRVGRFTYPLLLNGDVDGLGVRVDDREAVLIFDDLGGVTFDRDLADRVDDRYSAIV